MIRDEVSQAVAQLRAAGTLPPPAPDRPAEVDPLDMTPLDRLRQHRASLESAVQRLATLEAEGEELPSEGNTVAVLTQQKRVARLQRDTPALERAAEAFEQARALATLDTEHEAGLAQLREIDAELEAALETVATVLRRRGALWQDLADRFATFPGDPAPALAVYVVDRKLYHELGRFVRRLQNHQAPPPRDADPVYRLKVRSVVRADNGEYKASATLPRAPEGTNGASRVG